MGQCHLGQKIGCQCICRRIHESPCRAETHQDHEDRPHMPEGGKRENQQGKCADNFNKQAQGYDQPPLELAGDKPRDQHQ